jgi:hypothetical protein
MAFLPLPFVNRVKEVFSFHLNQDLNKSFVLIVPTVGAGMSKRYDVIRVFYAGNARCIGRELPIRMAREVAIRDPRQDGKPLKENA